MFTGSKFRNVKFKIKGVLFVLLSVMLALWFIIFAFLSKSEIDNQLITAEELRYKSEVLRKAQLSAYNAVADLTVLFQEQSRDAAVSLAHEKFLDLLLNYEKIGELYPDKISEFRNFMRSLADSINQPSHQKIKELADELSTFQTQLDKQLADVVTRREQLVVSYTEGLQNIFYRSVIMAVCVVILLALVVSVFFHRLTSDIKSLNFLLGRLLYSSNEPFEIDLNRTDELQDLAEKISELSERLRQRDESLLLLHRQRARLEQNKATEHLIRGLVHSIGNPVTGLLGSIQQLQTSNLSDEEQLKLLTAMNETAERLLAINEDMKHLSQRTGNERELLELNFIVSEQIRLMTYDDKWFGIKTEFIPGSDLPAVLCSKDDLMLIIENLLENSLDALMHSTQSEKLITIETLSPDSSHVGFIVSDNGGGMPIEVKNRAFDAFYSTKTDASQGDGMGLLMCLNLVEKYGGKLQLESQDGIGTTVSVLFPVISESNFITTTHSPDDSQYDHKLSQMILSGTNSQDK